jgi:hypothetical protein
MLIYLNHIQRLRVLALDILSCWQPTDIHFLSELSRSPKESLEGDGVLADVVKAVVKSILYRTSPRIAINSETSLQFPSLHDRARCTGNLVGVFRREVSGTEIATALKVDLSGATDDELPVFATGVTAYLVSPQGARTVSAFEMTMAVRLMVEHLSLAWTKACVVNQLLPVLAADTATFGSKLYNIALIIHR